MRWTTGDGLGLALPFLRSGVGLPRQDAKSKGKGKAHCNSGYMHFSLCSRVR